MNEARMNYTGATVVETVKEAGKVAWMQRGKIGCLDAAGKFVEGSVAYPDGSVKPVAQVAVGDQVSYIYNNVEIPQEDLPQLTAEMKGIELAAKARRIAIYYSQMAA